MKSNNLIPLSVFTHATSHALTLLADIILFGGEIPQEIFESGTKINQNKLEVAFKEAKVKAAEFIALKAWQILEEDRLGEFPGINLATEVTNALMTISDDKNIYGQKKWDKEFVYKRIDFSLVDGSKIEESFQFKISYNGDKIPALKIEFQEGDKNQDYLLYYIKYLQ